MELIKQHISYYLHSFVNGKSRNFDNTLKETQNDLSTKLIGLIQYLDNLLDETFSSNNEIITALHIHFEDEFNDSIKLLIAEFFNIKTFKNYHSIDRNTIQTDFSINELIAKYKTKQYSLEMKCPDGASGKNGGNKIWKNWVKDKKENRSLLEFYQRLNDNSSLKPKSIFNTQKNFCSSVSQIFEFKPFCVVINSKNKSYNILNATNTLNEIDIINNEIIDGLDLIVLFDCERKSLMSNFFSFEEINKWNSDYDTNFRKYLIITFGKEYQSIQNVRNKIDTIKERFKIPVNSSYTVLASEIDILLKRKHKSSTSIEFIGFESSSFWDIFLLETSIRELYELRSIKLMNIYSICFSHEIKSYIIDDLFSRKETSELISSSTKMAIIELRDEDIDTLKDSLSNTLDLIINLGIKLKIIESLTNAPTIIFDEAIIRNEKLITKITDCIGVTRSLKLKTWSDLINSSSNYFLILSYRDQGKFPNYYYPNLLEFEYHPETTVKSILPNLMFSNHYKWSKYYILKEYNRYLTHPIRNDHFEWAKLKNIIQNQKPDVKLNIDWNLENEYSNSEQRETFKIKLKNQKVKTFNSSDLFIISDENNLSLKVVKIDFLMSLENDDSKIFIQNLDEIQENINIYEKIVDKKQQDAELEVIRKQFNLGDESAGRLWKILLKKNADKDGEEKLYYDLKNYFESKGIKIVSQFHFKNSWINPQSESIAPLSKRVFIELCEYLKIPKIYFVIIQRIRNASKQSSRQSTRLMNQLLKDLFNDGCFDNEKNAKEIINKKLSFYKSNHPLDELGIDENYLADNLVTLTELIHPELKLLELETIEKLSNE